MVDVHTPERRSKNMRAIRSKDTKPELLLRRLLHAQGFRFRLHRKDLPGKPDIVLPKYRAAIQVHGCFWHGHKCYLFKTPKSQTEFWLNKINTNRTRDEQQNKALIDSGWRLLIVWECALKGSLKQPDTELISSISKWIKSDSRQGVCDFSQLPT